jgi:hypothetical protein
MKKGYYFNFCSRNQNLKSEKGIENWDLLGENPGVDLGTDCVISERVRLFEDKF